MPRPLTYSPLRLTLSYAAIASGWILVSDLLLDWPRRNPGPVFTAQSAKGLLFVAVTSVALHRWARKFHRGTRSETVAMAEERDAAETSRRMYATLSAINRQIVQPTDRTSLIRSLCAALIEPGGFRCAFIGTVDAGGTVVTPITACGGHPPAQFQLTGAEAALEPRPSLRAAIASGQPVVCPRVMVAGETRSCAVVPIKLSDGVPLVLAVWNAGANSFTPDVIAMLTELAADLQYGLNTIADRERRAAAEAAQRASEERYRLVAENSEDVIWILSCDAQIQYISPSVQRLLGYTPAQMMRMQFSDFLTADSYRQAAAELQSALAELQSAGHMRDRILQLEQIRADGTTIWTELHTMDFHDDAGQGIGILGVTRDITERRRAEQALAREVARCRALLDVSVDGIQVVDLDGKLLDANEIFLRERGFTRSMIPSLSVEQWNVELNAAEIRSRLGAIGAEPVLFETTHRRADGTPFSVEARAKRVEVDGQPMIYITTRDITERRSMEQRLLRAQRLESVGLIASGIAHDLNNVLTPILLSTGLLEMRYHGSEDAALLKPIEAAARRGSNIVQQILTFARGAEGQRVSIQPKHLLKELGTLIQETFPRNIIHRLNFSENVRSIIGDPTQLHQVFLNLAVNARDAMPSGGTLTIDVRNHQVDQNERHVTGALPGDYVCISVADTGTGMTSEVLDHIFEPFFTTKPRGRGTGLGLSTVHGLVKGHGGYVEVNSRLGHGSEFRVFLPAAPLAEVMAPASDAPARKRLGQGQLVLITDDEPAILNVLGSILRRQGFVPLQASDGAEALALLEAHGSAIAIVITDVMMPKFDGVRLATEVRRRHPELPLIAMSGMISPAPEEDVRQQLRDLGVGTILDKPYAEADLLRAIEKALSREADGRN